VVRHPDAEGMGAMSLAKRTSSRAMLPGHKRIDAAGPCAALSNGRPPIPSVLAMSSIVSTTRPPGERLVSPVSLSPVILSPIISLQYS